MKKFTRKAPDDLAKEVHIINEHEQNSSIGRGDKARVFICIAVYGIATVLFKYIYLYTLNIWAMLFFELLLWGVLAFTYKKDKFKYFNIILLCYAFLKLLLLLMPSFYYQIHPYIYDS